MSNWVYMNDKYVKYEDAVISVEDRGFQFGDGIYEVARVYDGHIYGLQEHITRMRSGAKEIEIPLPYSDEELTNIISETAERNGLKDGIVYWQLTRGTASRIHRFPEKVKPTLVVYSRVYPLPTSLWETGIKVTIEPDRRWLMCNVKTVNLLANCLAKEAAFRKGANEALLEREGYGVLEGGSSNLFIIKDGIIITAPLSPLILPGITRNDVFKLANKLAITVKEENISKDELLDADEVFVTSTGFEVMGVSQINNTPVGEGKPGPITKRLIKEYRNMITEFTRQ